LGIRDEVVWKRGSENFSGRGAGLFKNKLDNIEQRDLKKPRETDAVHVRIRVVARKKKRGGKTINMKEKSRGEKIEVQRTIRKASKRGKNTGEIEVQTPKTSKLSQRLGRSKFQRGGKQLQATGVKST